MSDLKGYMVRGEAGDVVYVAPVFALTPGQAKSLALKKCWEFDGWDYIEVEAKRCKAIDKYAKGNKPYHPPFPDRNASDEIITLYREAGIYEHDEPTCDTCGLSSFGKPEYEVCGGCNNCKECTGGCVCDTEGEA